MKNFFCLAFAAALAASGLLLSCSDGSGSPIFVVVPSDSGLSTDASNDAVNAGTSTDVPNDAVNAGTSTDVPNDAVNAGASTGAPNSTVDDGVATGSSSGTDNIVTTDIRFIVEKILTMTESGAIKAIGAGSIVVVRAALLQLERLRPNVLVTLDLSDVTGAEIASYCFYECKNLMGIVLPNDVTIIGTEAFYGCSCLANVTFSDSSGWSFENSDGDRTVIDSGSLANTATAAKYLRDTYRTELWKKNK